MSGSAQFYVGNFAGTGKARVMWFPTVAAARAEPRLFELATAIEVKDRGLFVSVPGSVAVDDGTELSPNIKLTAVTLGRFVFSPSSNSAEVFYSPTGAADQTALNALMAAESVGRRRVVVVGPGSFDCNVDAAIPSNIRLKYNSGTVITGAGIPIRPVSPVLGAATTLSGANTRGSNNIGTVASIPVGSEIAVGQYGQITSFTLLGFPAKVESVSGAGPYTVTTTDKIPTQFDAAMPVVVLTSRAKNIDVETNGCRIAVNNYAVYAEYADYLHVTDLNVDGTVGTSALHAHVMLIGCTNSWTSDTKIAGRANTGTISVWQSYQTHNFRPIVDVGTAGLDIDDSLKCTMTDFNASHCGSGVMFNSNGLNTAGRNTGSYECAFIGGTSSYNVNGVYVTNAAWSCLVERVSTHHNTTQGIIVDSQWLGNSPKDITIRSCSMDREVLSLKIGSAVDSGIVIEGKTKITNSAGSSIKGVSINGPVKISGDFNSELFIQLENGAYQADLSGLKLTCVNQCLYLSGHSGRCNVSASDMTTSTAGGLVVEIVSTSVLEIGTTRLTCAGASKGIDQYNGYASTVRELPGMNYAVNTAVSVGTSGKYSRGTIALNGATPVTYAFPDLKANDKVTVQRVTNGGTPGHFTWSRNVGVGVVITGTALDTSTMDVVIG